MTEKPFHEALREAMNLCGLPTAYSASEANGGPIEATEVAILNWLSGRVTPRQPRAYLAVLTLYREGRL